MNATSALPLSLCERALSRSSRGGAAEIRNTEGEALVIEVAVVSQHESPTVAGMTRWHTRRFRIKTEVLEKRLGLVLDEPITDLGWTCRADGPGKAPSAAGVWMGGLEAPLRWSSGQLCQHDEGTPQRNEPADRRQGLAPANPECSGVEQADNKESAPRLTARAARRKQPAN